MRENEQATNIERPMIFAHVNFGATGPLTIPLPARVAAQVDRLGTQAETIVALQVRIARLESQLDDTLKRLGQEATEHRRARQASDLEISRLKGELELFRSTQDEGVSVGG